MKHKNKNISAFLFLVFLLICNGIFAQTNDTANIPESYIVVSGLHVTGKHKTKDPLIFRELGFQQGDTLKSSELAERLQIAHTLLMNTNLFNSVEMIPTFSEDSTKMELTLDVLEAWQIFIIPQIKFADRNFNAWLHSDQPNKFGRISYGFTFKFGNFTGRRESLAVSLLAGYNYIGNIQYTLPFINKNKTLGIIAGINFSVSRETNYATYDDMAVFYRSENFFSRMEWTIFSGLQFRKNLFTTHQFKILYNNFRYDDTIYILNPGFSQKPYEIQQNIGLQYYLVVDHRNHAPYPTEGYFFDFEFTKLGMNLYDEYPNLYTLRSTFRKYWDLGKRWYVGAAANVYACSDPKYPFYLQYGLGYDRFYVRGYENNLVKTQAYALLKSNLKYAVLPEKTFYLKFIPFEKFNKIPLAVYANLFFDAGFTYDKQFTENNSYSNTALFGYGLGIDLASYYQRVIRFEFTMNKQNDFGVYFSFIAPL